MTAINGLYMHIQRNSNSQSSSISLTSHSFMAFTTRRCVTIHAYHLHFILWYGYRVLRSREACQIRMAKCGPSDYTFLWSPFGISTSSNAMDIEFYDHVKHARYACHNVDHQIMLLFGHRSASMRNKWCELCIHNWSHVNNMDRSLPV